MRKILSVALVLAGAFLFAPALHAQNFTTVTATVVDPNGIPYAGGSMSAVLTPGSSSGFTLGGQPYSGRVGPITLDSTGTFTANFGSNSAILPAGTHWQITVNSNPGGIAPPLGTGSQTFTATLTISGATQNISSALNALAPKLTNFAGGSGTVTSISGTSPIVATPNPITGTGSISCPTCAIASGSAASPEVAFWSSSTVITGSAAFTWNDPAEALNLFTGVPQSSFSSGFQNYIGMPPFSNNLFASLTNDTQFVGTAIQTEGPTDGTLTYGLYNAVKAYGTGAHVGLVADLQLDTLGLTNTQLIDSIESTYYGISTMAGHVSEAAGVQASFVNNGMDSFDVAAGLWATQPVVNSGSVIKGASVYVSGGSGTSTDNYGVYIESVSGGSLALGVFSDPSNHDQLSQLAAVTYSSTTNCSGVGTAANPSVASCSAAPAGSFSCSTSASGGTCRVATTAVTANSQIFVQEDDSLGTKLGVTCNVNNILPTTAPLLGARSAGASFTINLGTFTVNPLCFSYFIVN